MTRLLLVLVVCGLSVAAFLAVLVAVLLAVEALAHRCERHGARAVLVIAPVNALLRAAGPHLTRARRPARRRHPLAVLTEWCDR